MSKQSVKERLEEIISKIVLFEMREESEILSIRDKLHIILSESSQALALVTTIEDEFDIVLDDDDVDLDFFVDFEVMQERVYKSIPHESTRI
ncbi:hypothetical protein [uncultured Chitinophaga sp.]|jgi:hypothetical protein|uniref:hypothetical protein n=1 Tax=uncultured Chitinophaga sp. TaxID=339340 RepID=UPI0026287AAE|nr:hypothetical protein [uncultured Chitinophaga sp.]